MHLDEKRNVCEWNTFHINTIHTDGIYLETVCVSIQELKAKIPKTYC